MKIKVLIDEADYDVEYDQAGLVVEAGTLTVGERGSGSRRAYRVLRLLKVTSFKNCKRLDW